MTLPHIEHRKECAWSSSLKVWRASTHNSYSMMKDKHSFRWRDALLGSITALALICGMFFVSGATAHAAQGSGGFKSNRVIVQPHSTKFVPASSLPQSNVIDCPTVFGIQCYDPQQLQVAYGFDKLYKFGITGKGRTIVIVDAFQAPTIQADLHFFDQQFGLADPVFHQFMPDGAVPFSYANGDQLGWDEEITLDVEWSHAIAPDANIDLVLSKTDNDTDILSAERFAIDNSLGDVISQSFGENESCVDPNLLKSEHQLFQEATRKGITLLASAGDSGAAELSCDGTSLVKAVSSPASDPLVTSVGGTQLHADPQTGTYQSEVTWDAAVDVVDGAGGGGFSVIYKRPEFQRGVPGISASSRGLPDISYNASVNDGVLVFLTIPPIGGNNVLVTVFGGTSAGSPQWAGLTALSDQLARHRLGFLNTALYIIGKTGIASSSFHDITSGDNSFDNITGFSAQTGWDAATGWGTPKANVLVPLLTVLAHITDANGI